MRFDTAPALVPRGSSQHIRSAGALLSSIVLVCALGACSGGGDRADHAPQQLAQLETQPSSDAVPQPDNPYKESRARNLNRHVSGNFSETPEVLADDTPEQTGIATSQRFFDASDTVVVTDNDPAHQLRAASIAVLSHAPMLVLQQGQRDAVMNEIQRLGARYVLSIGQADLASSQGDRQVIRDPGTQQALGQMTARQFENKSVRDEKDAAQAVADLVADDATLLVPGWLPTQTTEQTTAKQVKVRPFPAQSRRDADAAPVVIATQDSSLAAIATVRAYGAAVTMLDHPDPRASAESMHVVVGLDDQPLVALGAQFGSDAVLAERIRHGEQAPVPLPGGGGLVWENRFVSGVYPAQAQTAEEAIAALSEAGVAQQGLQHATAKSVVAVAQGDAQDADALRKWVNALEPQDVFVWLKFTPGEVPLHKQIEQYHDALLGRHVGILIDTSQAAAAVRAQEIKSAARYTAQLVKEERLPQKGVIVAVNSPSDISEIERLDGDDIYLGYLMAYAETAVQLVDPKAGYEAVAEVLPKGWSLGIIAPDDTDVNGLSPAPSLVLRKQ